MLDIFRNNAFNVIPLSDTITSLKFKPGRIGAMGLFATASVASTIIGIERKGDMLVLVPPTNRGGPGTTVGRTRRDMLNLSIPHFEINDHVMAEEVSSLRAYGSETALETVQGMMAERMGVHTQSFEVTEEYARIGAIKGIVTYSDGSTLDLFSEFGVSQESEIDFDLDNANPTKGILRKQCAGVIRQMAGILDGLPYTGIHSFCGDAFYDQLIMHPEIRETYLQQQEASQLRQGYVDNGAGGSFGSFNFGGITWENYRGAVNGTAFIDTDKCHLFPTGVPELFKRYYAPADLNETVNTPGRSRYANMYEMPNKKGYHFDTQTNVLHICKRPKVLIKGKRT